MRTPAFAARRAAQPPRQGKTWIDYALNVGVLAAAVLLILAFIHALTGPATPTTTDAPHPATVTLTAAAHLPAAPVGNVGVVHFGTNLLTVETRVHGHTAGRVRTCLINTSGAAIKLVTARVYDMSRGTLTRLGAPMIRSGATICRTTGNWFRATRSWVSVRGVDQRTGAYGAASIPVFDYST
jgi:hypothetical protein